MYSTAQVSEIQLTIERIVFARRISDVDLEVARYPYLDGLVVTMQKEIAAWRGCPSETVRWPSDWWEAFKLRWFPLWAKTRWPVRYTTKTFDAMLMLPDILIPEKRNSYACIQIATDIEREAK